VSERQLTIRCPECQSELIVDAATGAIVAHRKAKAAPAGGRSFEELFSELEQGKERAERVFEQERAAFADRGRLLEQRFEEALKRAEENPDEPPPRPFDLD
jgi:hypothetical protein